MKYIPQLRKLWYRILWPLAEGHTNHEWQIQGSGRFDIRTCSPDHSAKLLHPHFYSFKLIFVESPSIPNGQLNPTCHPNVVTTHLQPFIPSTFTEHYLRAYHRRHPDNNSGQAVVGLGVGTASQSCGLELQCVTGNIKGTSHTDVRDSGRHLGEIEM